jgi:hypothetical protein
MKIQTIDGIKEVKVIKYITLNDRKFALHKPWNSDNSYSFTDYATGLSVSWNYFPKSTITEATEILSTDAAKNYDYSKHEIINH